MSHYLFYLCIGLFLRLFFCCLEIYLFFYVKLNDEEKYHIQSEIIDILEKNAH